MSLDTNITKQKLRYFNSVVNRKKEKEGLEEVDNIIESWIDYILDNHGKSNELVLSSFLRLNNKTSFHIIRHGETEYNAQGLVTGKKNARLTKAGEYQAKRAGQKLNKKYDIAICSTLDRSFRTLLITLVENNIDVNLIYKDRRLNERGLGVLESRPWRYLKEYSEGDLKYAPVKGENYIEVLTRVLYFVSDLIKFVQIYDCSSVLISSHMGPMRILRGLFEKEESSSAVLNSSFKNTEVKKYTCDKIYFPKFALNP